MSARGVPALAGAHTRCWSFQRERRSGEKSQSGISSGPNRFVDSVNSNGDVTRVRRLRPLRVLVSGRDRRFVRVTSFLLSQRGYDVEQANLKRTLESVQRHRSEIVVLETGNPRVMVARQVAALAALPLSPSVLVVFDDDGAAGWQGLETVEKWSSIESLVERIEAAARTRPAPAGPTEQAYL